MFDELKEVHFIQIFSKIVWLQSKAIRSSLYCPSYEGVRFIVCPLYRDSTVFKIFGFTQRTTQNEPKRAETN